MKHAMLWGCLAGMAVTAGCKMGMNDLLKKPSGATADDSGDESGGGGETGAGGGTGATATVAVESDLCTPLPDSASFDESLAHQNLAAKTTICEMVTVEPAPGVERVAAQKPGWCDKLSKDDLANAQAGWATDPMQRLAKFDSWWENTPTVLGSLCASPDDANVQKQTGYFYQWWENLTGASPAQLDGFFQYFATVPGKDVDLYTSAVEDACKAFPPADDEASARDQHLAKVTRDALGCVRDGHPFWLDRDDITDISWDIDAAAEPPSELLRAYFVASCLVPKDTIEDEDLAVYAMCGTDARALDGKAMEKEIAGYPELAKAQAHMLLGVAKGVAAKYEAAAQAKAKADPAWKTLLYDAPASAWKAWDALYQANKQAIDAARAYETVYFGPSRKAAKGCWDSAWDDFTAHAQAANASTLLDAKHAMTDTISAIILEHLVACADAEGDTMFHRFYGDLFGAAAPARGPRYATLAAYISALNDIQADRSKFSGGSSWIGWMFGERSAIGASGGDVAVLDIAGDDRGGVVKKVKKDGDVVHVEYKTDRWKDYEWNCVTTDRIRQVEADGSLLYEQRCTAGKLIWVESTHDAVTVPAALAGGIEAGSFIRVAIDTREGTAYDAIPVEVWKNKDRDVLTAYMGVKL